MKLGVFDPIYGALALEPMLDRIAELGLDAVELGCGNYPGDRHCRPIELLADDSALDRFRRAIESRGLIISALSCHGNPIHPDRDRAAHDDATFRDTVRLAERLGIAAVNVFSGQPGSDPDARQPSWVVHTWPPEHGEILRWQWDDVILPYWSGAGAFAREHGVRLAFEMHPNFAVYNTRTVATPCSMSSSVAAGSRANFDPVGLGHLVRVAEPVRAAFPQACEHRGGLALRDRPVGWKGSRNTSATAGASASVARRSSIIRAP